MDFKFAYSPFTVPANSNPSKSLKNLPLGQKDDNIS